jgi:heme/copper-type cytochrome/quinol oxidase subunit 3
VTDYAAPRSTEASEPQEVARVEEQRVGYPVGWWGMAILVASEATLFGVMFGTYFYLRFENVQWPPAGVPEPKVVVPLILAVVLLATTVPMRFASLAAQRGALKATRRLIFLALVVQSGYLAMEIHLYQDDLRHFSQQSRSYGSIYFTLLGADHAHVAIGLLLSVWLLLKLARGLTAYRLNAVRAIAFYWYFVNILTLFVTLTIVYPAL